MCIHHKIFDHLNSNLSHHTVLSNRCTLRKGFRKSECLAIGPQGSNNHEAVTYAQNVNHDVLFVRCKSNGANLEDKVGLPSCC
jgi:hypothetical protein